MEKCLSILCEQINNVKSDYIGLTECCCNMLEFSSYIASPERDIHNKPLANIINRKLSKLYKMMKIIQDKIDKI